MYNIKKGKQEKVVFDCDIFFLNPKKFYLVSPQPKKIPNLHELMSRQESR